MFVCEKPLVNVMHLYLSNPAYVNVILCILVWYLGLNFLGLDWINCHRFRYDFDVIRFFWVLDYIRLVFQIRLSEIKMLGYIRLHENNVKMGLICV
jgi:hypothetical protein